MEDFREDFGGILAVLGDLGRIFGGVLREILGWILGWIWDGFGRF